jgi:hypothetical protein
MDEADDERKEMQKSIEAVKITAFSIRDDVRDGHYRIGNALIPVHGRNPMIPDAEMVTTPLRDKMDKIDNSLARLEKAIATNADYIRQQHEEQQARQKWRREALPKFIKVASSVVSSPFVINNAIKILGGGALITAITALLQSLTGAK